MLRRQIRENACRLSIATINEHGLFVEPVCVAPRYEDLFRLCKCATHSHGRKGCGLRGKIYCPSCDCAIQRGLIRCGSCEDALDATMKLRSDFFLRHFAASADEQQVGLF